MPGGLLKSKPTWLDTPLVVTNHVGFFVWAAPLRKWRRSFGVVVIVKKEYP